MWNCGGILEIDDPGYRWAKFGSCVESCSVAFRTDSCLFRARYGMEPEETSSDTEQQKKRKEKSTTAEEKKSKREKPPEKQQEDKTGKLETEELPTKPETKGPRKEKRKKPEGKASVSGEEKKTDEAVVEGTPTTEDDEISKKEDETDYVYDFDAQYGVYDDDDDADTITEDQDKAQPVSSVPTDKDINPLESAPLPKTKPVTEDSDPSFLSPNPALQTPAIDQSDVELVSTPVQLDKDRPPSGSAVVDFEIYRAPWMPCRQPCNQSAFGSRIQVWIWPSSMSSI